MTEAYPLHWPQGRPRARSQSKSRFGMRSIDHAMNILCKELERLGASMIVISSNMRLRQDGLPYSKQSQPEDKGVAVYFSYQNRPMCFACDRWEKVQDNVYACAMTIEALRGIARWGTGEMMQAAFTGFLALEAPKDPHVILGVERGASYQAIMDAYKRKAMTSHPDQPGGSAAAMADLNIARDKLIGKGI